MTSPLDLDTIEQRAREAAALAEAATAGPWYEHWGHDGLWGIAFTGEGNDGAEHYVSTKSTIDPEETAAEQDAAFIAASRTAVPALAADVAALVAEVRRLAMTLEAAQAALRDAIASNTANGEALDTARALLLERWDASNLDAVLDKFGHIKPFATDWTRRAYNFLWPEGKAK